ncbi:MAG: YqcC family protein [Halomonas subglaciescola]|nr:YqcC family protein [Halomonas subglaciescola]
MTIHQELEKGVEELEATLKATDLWRVDTPPAAAFESQQPFCVDTMTLPQWLRFVFAARLYALIDARAPLPAKCEVAPAVAAYLQQQRVRASDQLLVVQSVERIDELISAA